MAKKFCASFPCSNLAEQGSAYCPEHRPARAEKKTDPFYLSVRWRRFRDWYRKLHPLCQMCEEEGRGPVPARLVDHRIELKSGGAETSEDNATSMCFKCHAIKTANSKNNTKL